MKITTKIGVEETVGDTRWQSPFHQNTSFGRAYAGVKSPRYDKAHVKGKLTDRKIKQYVKEGFYSGERRRPAL